MFAWRPFQRSRQKEDVPTEIYISIVDSLYSDSRTLFLGTIAVTIAALLAAWKTGELLLYLCAAAMIVVGIARAVSIRAYFKKRPYRTREEAHHWELQYAVGTSAHVALLGIWCVVSFATTSDSLVHLVSVVSTIANLIGIAGRNFASKRLVLLQSIFAAPPLTVALMLPGDIYHIIYAILLLAFFVSVKFIADRLRVTLINAVIATRDVTLLAARFDTALNNMPHGLCMFDTEKRLVVCNSRLTEMLRVDPEIVQRRPTVQELLDESTVAGMVPAMSAAAIVREFDAHLSNKSEGEVALERADGRKLAVTFQPMANGGSVVLFEDITERTIAESRIRYLARYDALTGLPNRIFFHDQLDATLIKLRGSNQSCALLFIDLDQFKQINDTMGHPFGDELLYAVSTRLRALVRESDVVARFGGDEFIILQSPLQQPEQAASLARSVVEALSQTFEIDGNQVLIGASIGIAIAPQDGADPDLLLKNADMALYRVKAEGRGAWRFFEMEMDVKAQARRGLENDLRVALANDSFVVYYQPLFNLKSKRIATCEALLRWPHPERGMISPAEFIPVAEEMGLIVEIGKRVLHQACAECKKWPAHVRVAVNLSPIQFRRGNIVDIIREALAASQLPAKRLEVEITESVLVQDTEAARSYLHQLRDMGVRVSLDDFGTGYSSLSYLHSFPLDKVKIDRSFLQGLAASERSLTLLRGVARLSAELGMSVAVEGVETDEELAIILRETSVDEAQGYLFSPALPGVAIRSLLGAARSKLVQVA